MKHYPLKLKRTIQKKLLPPYNLSVSLLAKTEGISKTTLNRWRNEALVLNGANVLEQLQQDNKKTKNPHLKHNPINLSLLSLHIVLNVSVIP
ncbi:hypothetical protein [Xenorhabdus bovienii]|uniref:hypothetical protein n=1 Tax=Xenorhabdus bovienii TaxID=40576 RepID=UPI0004D5D9F8|nr:hypothetical protein [Xenorhabdus bovienii]CDG88627.1 hypothetical protein XBFFR1_2150040 [Xenorhabdus bovienii str. feltiae France]CDG94767.1 hypothetical protein XBFFL1_910030 [Xenorhabdus bovienii str. feltiae Florida]